MLISDYKIIILPKISDSRGSLSFVEDLPFEINRMFYLYDLSISAERGFHAHKKCVQFIIPISGQFYIRVDDGNNSKNILLNCPDMGILIPPMFWIELYSFSPGSICMVLASEKFDECDYIRDYREFFKLTRL